MHAILTSVIIQLKKCSKRIRENHALTGKAKGPAKTDPFVLTNPLNSIAKLQIEATKKN